MVSKIAVGLVLIILVGYGVLKALPLIEGPTLSLESPVDGETSTDGLVTIRGTVARANALLLNGAALLSDEKGNFSSTLAFPREPLYLLSRRAIDLAAP